MKTIKDLDKEISELSEQAATLNLRRLDLEQYRHLLYQEQYTREALLEYRHDDK